MWWSQRASSQKPADAADTTDTTDITNITDITKITNITDTTNTTNITDTTNSVSFNSADPTDIEVKRCWGLDGVGKGPGHRYALFRTPHEDMCTRVAKRHFPKAPAL